MLLEGFLVKTLSEEDPHADPEAIAGKLAKTCGHNLQKAWTRFKKEVAEPSLDQFEPWISDLHKFEGLHHPNDLAFNGAIIKTGLEQSDLGP